MLRNAIAVIVLWLCCDISLAQNIVVDTVEIHVEGMRPHDISLPRLTDKHNPQSVHMAGINKAILNHYDLEAYNVGSEADYSWFIHSFKFEQSADLIYSDFEAAYVSNRAYDHEWEV